MANIMESVFVEVVANALVALFALSVALTFVGSGRRRLRRFMGVSSDSSVSVAMSQVNVETSTNHRGVVGFQGEAVPLGDLDGLSEIVAAFERTRVFDRIIALFPFVPKALHINVDEYAGERPSGPWIAQGTGMYNRLSAFCDDVSNEVLPSRIVYFNDGRDAQDPIDPGVRAFVLVDESRSIVDDEGRLLHTAESWVRSPKRSYALVQRIQWGGTRESPDAVLFMVAGLDALGTRLAARTFADNARAWARDWKHCDRPASCAWILTVPGPESEPTPDWNPNDNLTFKRTGP